MMLNSFSSRSTATTAARPTITLRPVKKLVRVLFYIFVLYMVLPVVDVPLLGLSLSAPIFFVIALEVLFRPRRAWIHRYRGWIWLAAAIWLGILLSGFLNGILSVGMNFDSDVLVTIIRYAYWLLVFVVTAYLVSEGGLGAAVGRLLGWGAFALALLRWGEVLLYGNIGAWTGTHLMSQNSYGFIFSTFAPFLFMQLVQARGWRRWLAVIANITLWGAAAVNGSRGSWVAVGVAVTAILLLLLLTRPGRLALPVTVVLLVAAAGTLVLATPNPVSVAVEKRFSTFNTLEQDKSYEIRLLMNQKSLRLFQQNPILGVGPSRYTKTSTPLDIPILLRYAGQRHFDVKSSHNSYLGFLAETGLAGAVPFGILLLILVIKGGLSAWYLVRRRQYWAAGVFGGFVGMSVHMWAIASLTNSANWMVYGLVAGMIVTAGQMRRREVRR